MLAKIAASPMRVHGGKPSFASAGTRSLLAAKHACLAGWLLRIGREHNTPRLLLDFCMAVRPTPETYFLRLSKERRRVAIPLFRHTRRKISVPSVTQPKTEACACFLFVRLPRDEVCAVSFGRRLAMKSAGLLRASCTGPRADVAPKPIATPLSHPPLTQLLPLLYNGKRAPRPPALTHARNHAFCAFTNWKISFATSGSKSALCAALSGWY